MGFGEAVAAEMKRTLGDSCRKEGGGSSAAEMGVSRQGSVRALGCFDAERTPVGRSGGDAESVREGSGSL